MINKIKILIAIGGTGGHVFPGLNLAKYLIKKKFIVELVSDNRGLKYLKNIDKIKISTLPFPRFNTKNIFLTFFSSILLFFSVFRSLIFLLFNRPTIIFGMGGYASFPICIAAKVLRIKLIIYENNLITGKANKFLAPFANKIIVSHEEVEGVLNNYSFKIQKIGNIINQEILNFKSTHFENLNYDNLRILVLGGSQAAKVFAEILPNIFRECLSKGVKLKIFQHCLPAQNEELKLFYEKFKIDHEIFNFSSNLVEYFSKINLAITRSGSSILAELTNANIPFISVPLPSAAENHQLKNAIYYKKKGFSFLIEEKDLNVKLAYLLVSVFKDNSKLAEIKKKQSQYSDKYVYNNIENVIKEIMYEKN